jgi:hypothetical protein
MAKCNDPVRAEAYAHLGIATVCRTNLMITAILEHLGQAAPVHAGIYAPAQHHSHADGDAHVIAGQAVGIRPAGAAGITTTTEA